MQIEFKQPVKGYPNLMILSGQPGVGKSSLIVGLNKGKYKSLHIDLQGGAAHVGGYIVDVKGEADKNGWSLARAWKETIKSIRKMNAENGSPVYDFVTIDPLSSFKDIIITLSAKIYNESVVGRAAMRKAAEEKYGPGQKFTPEMLNQFASKDPVSDIGQNGWNFYNQAWKEIISDISNIASKCVIIIAHTKYNTLKKTEITEVSVKEIDFWPSYLLELIGTASDSGSLYRKDNQVIASFVLKDSHQHFKSRNFDGQEFVLSVKEGDEIKTMWEQIFPFLNKEK